MNGFVEINESEMMNIDGGWDWGIVLGGTALFIEVLAVSHSVVVAAATAPVSIPVAAALCAASALSGSAVAYGATH